MPEIFLPDEEATLTCGERIARVVKGGGLVCLAGELGAGKTTLCRGILRGLGHEGRVKSPTFTLVEPYEVDSLRVFHVDLYRVTDGEELEYIGIDDYFSPGALTLVEWPENGAGWLPRHQLWLRLTRLRQGRTLTWCEDSEWGRELQSLLSKD